MQENIIENNQGCEVPSQTERISNKDLIKRSNNWARERLLATPPRYKEYEARRQIVAAIKADLKDANLNNEAILSKAVDPIRTLERRGVPIKVETKDSITGEPFQVGFRREEGAWVAEERRGEEIISQARVSDNGTTELTLHFSGPRYQKMNANPGIMIDRRFPSATFKVFELLVGTLKK